MIFAFFTVIFIAACLLTGLLRQTALKHSLMDIPNDRSSHSIATPRGGGLSFVISFLLACPVLGWFGLLPVDAVIAFMGAGVMVAIMGFIDDHGHVAARWRLLVHFTAAGWGLYWLGGLPPLSLLGLEIDLGWLGHFLAAIYLVWLLNLYNFMDGIDGIASVESIAVCFGGMVILIVTSSTGVWILPAALGVAVAGFLCWNFPPAKIFMGDAGSGFLGMTIGLMSIVAAQVNPSLFWSWIILSGVFIVDATLTLIRRIIRNEVFHEAHRSHAYQYASRLYQGHKPVTLAVAGINLIFLLPVALLVAIDTLSEMTGLLITYIPLIVLAFYFKAGAKDLQGTYA